MVERQTTQKCLLPLRSMLPPTPMIYPPVIYPMKIYPPMIYPPHTTTMIDPLTLLAPTHTCSHILKLSHTSLHLLTHVSHFFSHLLSGRCHGGLKSLLGPQQVRLERFQLAPHRLFRPHLNRKRQEIDHAA